MTMQEKSKKERSHADWAMFAVGFFLFLGIGFWVTPKILYAEKPQPFQFSHALHVKQVAEGCNSCHWLREDGSFSGIPGIDVCAECHEGEPMGKTPEEKVFTQQYMASFKPIPWQKYSKQPDCVFFSHAPHLKKGKLECAKCHGAHGESEELRKYEYNRISTYSRDIWGWSILGLGSPPERMKMDDCAACHREHKVRDACFVCHK